MTTEVSNAFLGKQQAPSKEELEQALGPATPVWSDLIHWFEQELRVATQEWRGVYTDKYGWTLRLKQKSRTVAYLSPCRSCFHVAFTLSDKAISIARCSDLPKPVAQVLATAPRYPEGNGVRLLVKTRSDLEPIRRLAHIKLEN